ncbi:MAG: PadR family transcriptional regulator [Candidatus Eremiobacteraeota bacterium]|nr:PadR family transcriptional regulator [Candidatus Eremiobacteraeota bacterium]MBV8283402.1 PadR family transcriptional regulator [Candidatus Eremiobacteraeota bacterium]MBV8435150.1 PadR family transcriptional regulator [Candidatus Eremiobacteraeota bacterium]MBV8583048.1 PadR family transcriptional regulator [Candidatus Eremiobacteraeota bacterium]
MKRGLLKFVILKLLAESSRHGYDLMRIFAERGWGSGRPGSIYPILNALEEEGLVTSRAEGERRVYEITEKGRQYLSEHGAHAFGAFERFFEGRDEDDESDAPSPVGGLREAASRLMQAIGQVGQSKPETIERVRELLDKTRKDIYTLLAQE